MVPNPDVFVLMETIPDFSNDSSSHDEKEKSLLGRSHRSTVRSATAIRETIECCRCQCALQCLCQAAVVLEKTIRTRHHQASRRIGRFVDVSDLGRLCSDPSAYYDQ